MARKDYSQLKIDEVIPFANEKYEGIKILWSDPTIGWGEYTLFKEAGGAEWFADSEHMDWGEDKTFLETLMKRFIEMIEIH